MRRRCTGESAAEICEAMTKAGHKINNIQQGRLPDRPGWGTEPNEEALRAHPPKTSGGLLNYGRKS